MTVDRNMTTLPYPGLALQGKKREMTAENHD
jgi:hypothetical protein